MHGEEGTSSEHMGNSSQEILPGHGQLVSKRRARNGQVNKEDNRTE